MSVSRARPSEIPRDAVIIDEEQALVYQWKLISGWDKPREVWALQYTPGIIASCATLTGVYVNNHYRNKLRLGSYGRFSTYLPIVALPAMFTFALHKFLVQRPLVLDPMGGCPTCLQMRAMVCQTGFGVIYPTLLAPFAACMFATRHFTYRLPSITEKPLEVLQLIRKMTRPIVPTLGAIFAGHALLTIYLTYKEQHQLLRVLSKMRMLEQRVEEELGL